MLEMKAILAFVIIALLAHGFVRTETDIVEDNTDK
jgi:hypothetical protein